MQDEELEPGKNAAAADPLPLRALDWVLGKWRPAASGLALVLTLLLGWHVVSGKNGLSVWEEKRAEDRQLTKQIDSLQQENARLRERVDRLKSDPDEIGLVARDKLHYAKPNEVIVALPPDKPAQTSGQTK